jgi:hypothetical protein
MKREPRSRYIYTAILVALPWLLGGALWMIFR